jgi:adenylate cyclase
LALALLFTAWVRNLRKEWPLAEERADATIALSTEQGFAYILIYGTIHRGWAQTEQGRVEEGIAQVRHAVAATSHLEAKLFRANILSHLASGCSKLGQTGHALALVGQALAVAETSGENHWQAEIYRLKGELLLNSKESPEAESCFRHAIDIARRQSAKSLELRAVTSLSRLLQEQSKGDEGRQMLAEIYGWFTEGFDTADLKDAQALLEELSA